MEPHPSASLQVTASWNGQGDDRFKSAMSNFLAEVPEFFLQDQNFTSFISKFLTPAGVFISTKSFLFLPINPLPTGD